MCLWGAAAAEEHSPEHQCHHGSDAHADTGLCALAQLFTGGDALEDQQRDGNKQDAVHDGQQDEPVGGVLLGGNGLCACSLAIGAGGGQSALPVGAGNVLLDTKIENYLSNFEKDFAFGSPQTVTPVPHPAPSSPESPPAHPVYPGGNARPNAPRESAPLPPHRSSRPQQS